MRLQEATWPLTANADLVLIPLGATQQHGPHLPLDTDTVIALAVADALALRHPGAWVAPAIAYGSSGEHQMFSGTSSVGSDALRTALVELVRSVRTWSRRVVFVNAHGGNLDALRTAVAQLVNEGYDASWVDCATEEVDLHAGFTETSLMLHLRPASVRMDRAEPGNSAPIGQILPTLLEHGMAAVTPNGVLGDPAGASPQFGAAILAAIVERAAMEMS